MENHKDFKITEALYANTAKMDGLYLDTSSIKCFLVNPFSRLQKISKGVPLCTHWGCPQNTQMFSPTIEL